VEHQPAHRRRGAGEALSAAAPDTIVAAATPPGRGGIAIVRISGERVPAFAAALLGALPAPRAATLARMLAADGSAIDEGLALYFPAPHSYTGEHVLELHAHGGPVTVERLVRRALEFGARRAAPGEFTQRAYLNGKLDLAQAEAVAALIDAASEAAAGAALRSLEGELSTRVEALGERLGELRAYVEAAIDFADEEIDFLSDAALGGRLQAVQAQLAALQRSCVQGRLLTEGLKIVIAGLPNVGKSTLLNRLAGYESAIVTPIPGTTRDVLRERVLLDGVPLEILDTAGLRDTEDPIEAEGVRRAQDAIAHADRLLFVIDAASDPAAKAWTQQRAAVPAGLPVTLVFNKSDLCATAPFQAAHADSDPGGEPAVVRISALSGEGLDALREHLKTCFGLGEPEHGTIAARARHVEALARVAAHLDAAGDALRGRRTSELIAEELRLAEQALGEIVGPPQNEELLGRIFGSFCIGK
jgi:tRNA modification GTPase